ncbi:MAG: valine--tRNA ligase [Deltaproteobacteria bacterium]|nr:valine--tRNA ligase [Deltaproteobacteria bacterium]
MDGKLLDKGYEPQAVEKHWYAYWLREGLFAAKETSKEDSYAIVIPPPNVTGVLHIGHGLNITLQDILCRYRRLCGDNVLWMPGSDHAGIATQNVVERHLASEGLDRHQLGREKFIEKVWEWREKSGGAIINQLKRLGASCDWDRERFTMDEGLSKAVRKVFVGLYDQGLIYRGNYITNWCPRCLTALSDLEVEHEEIDGHLYHIRYPFTDGSGAITIATTRPETMLGDTAVAVHPEDERYRDLSADSVMLPLMDRPIPIIRDDYVDMAFGSGGLKVTPAHDPNDFEIGRRHHLPELTVIGDDGNMTAEAGKFAGMDRFKCRKAVVAELDQQGLLEKIEDHKHGVGHCYRCKSVVEPNLSRQWFVKAKPLADKALDAVKQGHTRIIPDIWEKTYFDWMENIRDWCISRQIWWGHQIPAWTCTECGELIVATETPEACPKCKAANLVQESDVLDTWFSSALWPFSTMGWPDKTPLLKTFYPTSTLVTAFDILFFWVARMMMMGIHFMDDVPFKDVYIHALVRDENGQKMSKSKGNVIDPLETIDQFGTDAFRFTLAAFAAQGRDIRMSEKRVEGYRNFINKLWNAARFSLMHVKAAADLPEKETLSLPDRWILSRLYKFVWHEFCDWYLELIKPALYDETNDAGRVTSAVLARVLKETLILLHPFIPFVTEEIWHKLPGTDNSIMLASYPQVDGDGHMVRDAASEANMALVMQIITGVRNIRGEMNLAPSLALNATVHIAEPGNRETALEHETLIKKLARLNNLVINQPGEKPPASATAIVQGATVFVPLEEILDIDKEVARLNKELAKLEVELKKVSKKLSNEGFLSKAPEEVVAKVRQKYDGFVEKQQKLETHLKKVQSIG